MSRLAVTGLLVANLCCLPMSDALAQSKEANCTAIKSDKERLTCFDAVSKGDNKASSGDDAAIKNAMEFIRAKFKNPRTAKFGAATRSMRSNGYYEMDTVCGSVNGLSYFYWVAKNDGAIDDGSMANSIGYKIWCG